MSRSKYQVGDESPWGTRVVAVGVRTEYADGTVLYCTIDTARLVVEWSRDEPR